MQLSSLCLLMSCLRVSPDRSQFFKYDSVSLSCEDELNSTVWRVKRNTSKGGVTTCTFGWGSTPTSSTCFIGNIYPSDSGVYWCESGSGERSNKVNITITDHAVILESPALPVPHGDAVTLGCKAKQSSSNGGFDFYKDGRSIGSSSTGQMTLQRVSASDEGLYSCSVSGGEESVGSWLAVKARNQSGLQIENQTEASPPLSSPPVASCSVSVFRLVCHLAVGAPYLLSTIVLGLIYRDRRVAQTAAERRGSKDVIMEIVQ
ncbi:Fc receptor-like protein 5 isoform X2 [Notolabrus celidotus]|uniref:Fc receptor-like protein 5 isoform X2 n=1 Tax=Notolabrus celidotus TaxID=1203425 RepID=UPI00148FF64E|nr:Fc receptor-like protein 5 isoform X2 [Notolabrus celidotus]